LINERPESLSAILGGLEVEEAAESRTFTDHCLRDWKMAKAWLHRALSDESYQWKRLDELSTWRSSVRQVHEQLSWPKASDGDDDLRRELEAMLDIMNRRIVLLSPSLPVVAETIIEEDSPEH